MGSLYFKGDCNPFTIRAKSQSLRYLVATKDPYVYSIIDTIGGTCGPNDRVFNPYDMNDDIDIKKSLSDLEDGKINISHVCRRGALITNIIDLDKTFADA